MPRELSKAAHPTYVIEPPDILLIEAVNVTPKPPYKLKTSDILSIQVQGTLPDAPISGPFAVEPGGVVNLGFPYGNVQIAGSTVDEAKELIDKHLRQFLKEPIVLLSLVELAGQQQIVGEHLVFADGTVNLGTYGSVSLVGQTLEQAKETLEMHLAQFLDDPEVNINVFAFNSKVYYVITEGAGLGDQVSRFPVTGNETVLDAIANVSGTQSMSSKRIWIARPTPFADEVQVLPVDWKAITAQGSTITNYQVFPGDRVFISEDELVAADTRIGKLLAPVERVMGFGIFGLGVVSRFALGLTPFGGGVGGVGGVGGLGGF
jgi:protein involved in polysaccharide export with SLBB domain